MKALADQDFESIPDQALFEIIEGHQNSTVKKFLRHVGKFHLNHDGENFNLIKKSYDGPTLKGIRKPYGIHKKFFKYFYSSGVLQEHIRNEDVLSSSFGQQKVYAELIEDVLNWYAQSFAPEPSTQIPLTEDEWTVIYDGYGEVSFENDQIYMAPMESTDPYETHAALVVAKTTVANPVQDFSITIEFANLDQLRDLNPNPWEVFWLFFNYVPTDTGKETNYYIFKPNGQELGRAFDEIGQYFLPYTWYGNPLLNIEQRYVLELEKVGQVLEVYIDGVHAMTYEGQTWPNEIYDVPGWIGLYTEDAAVEITSVELERWD